MERITIKVNANSVPCGMFPTTYGDKKINSDSKRSPINIETKITPESKRYQKFENTIFTVLAKSNHIIHNLLESAVGLSPLKLFLLVIWPNYDKGRSSFCPVPFGFRYVVLYSFGIFARIKAFIK